MNEAVRKYLSEIASRGGKSGVGKSKVRGDVAFYKRISAMAAKARKHNAQKRKTEK